MPEIGALEAEGRLGELLDRVEAGEEVVITRGGKVVAKLVRYASPRPLPDPCAMRLSGIS